jgi:hypothetical protein
MGDQAAGSGPIRQVAVRVILSSVGGGAFYLGWMVLFLLTADWQSALWDTAVWFLSPVVTAVGFAAGLALGRRLTGRERMAFWRLYLWPLVGCSLGAAVVFPFGPMLIVFGMLAAGVTSVTLREVLDWIRRGRAAS